jgi:hypothetical protein
MTHLVRLGVAALVLLAGSTAAARLRPVPGASPTNGQEVAPDLSDPDMGGVIRIRYRFPASGIRRLAEGTEEDPLLTLRDQDLADVPFAWTYDPIGRILEMQPGLPLPGGQYAVSLGARALGRRPVVRGRIRDFATSFTVGPDTYAPLLLRTRPSHQSLDARRTAPVVATFNESLDPGSVVLGETVIVENLSVQPPIPIPGTITLDRDGFDMVFRAAGALPAASIVGVRLLGVGNPNRVTDAVGNGLEGDPEDGNQVRFHFSTAR